MTNDPPGSPGEAWLQRARQVRETLRERSDDELLELVRNRQIDLSGGIWDILKERNLDERVVREIMTLLVVPPEKASDEYLTRFHAACALMDLTQFPAEIIDWLGPTNNSARRIANDQSGEKMRQEELRAFWVEFKQHCQEKGLKMDWEPPWPEKLIRYRAENRLENRRPPDKSFNPRSMRDKMRHANQVCLKNWEAPEDSEPQHRTEVITEADDSATERMIMRYKRANLVIAVDCLRREAGSEQWTLPKEVLIVCESDSAAVKNLHMPLDGPCSVLFSFGYVYQ